MPDKTKTIAKKPVPKRFKVVQTKKSEHDGTSNAPIDHIMSLHQTLGNHAVQRLFESGTIQAKLKIGQPNDKYEQEADRVADAVMRMPEPQVQRQNEEDEEEEMIQTKPIGDQITPLIQRQVEPEEEEEAEPEKEEEEEETIQTKSEEQTPQVTSSLESKINALQGGGQSLSKETRNFFEPRFGQDFSNVKIHTDSNANQLARSINARAFTKGSDIIFGGGEYSPGSSDGKRLLGHELTHVVQQSAEALPIVQRAITEESIKTKNGDFYSTHCGWVDTGHANPKGARNLIAYVQEASQRIERKEKALNKTLSSESPGLVRESTCSGSYEEGEQAASSTDSPVMDTNEHPSGMSDVFLGGFEVNSFDPTKFTGLLQTIAQSRVAWETIRSQEFSFEVWGLSDCIGRDERNDKLRSSRAGVIAFELAKASKGETVDTTMDHALTDYAASNSTRDGRRKNRGVLIRLIPHVASERFDTPTMESRKWGVQVSAVTPQAELTRSLSKDEVLSVTLTIFATQSTAFEQLQAWRDVIPFTPPSSKFAEEDLPSNLIGFYRAARGFSIDEVRSFCGAWDKQCSIDKLKGYKFVSNTKFMPQRLPPGGSWPTEFQTIAPAPFNSEIFKILRLKFQTPLFGYGCSIDAKGNFVNC